MRAFADAAAAERARVLLSACDDLMAPRTLGPLRDAAAGERGPLAAALADEQPIDAVFGALLEELAAEPPTVLVVEDIHWADDATLDVLGYAARRIEQRRRGARAHLPRRRDRRPATRCTGSSACSPAARCTGWRCAPLSLAAVRELCAGTGADAEALHRVTRGNPFFVTEALASPGDAVPVSVVEAVLARVRRLGPGVPRGARPARPWSLAQVDLDLAAALLGRRFEALAEAEARRRARGSAPTASRSATSWPGARSSSSLPAIRRRQLNAAVVAALRAQERPERARLMHHAVEAGDVDTIVAVGPGAAREAAQAGSHRQALAHFESVLPHLRPARRARARRTCSTPTAGSSTTRTASARRSRPAARRLELYEQLDDPVAAGECLVRLSRHLFMAGDTDAAEATARSGR